MNSIFILAQRSTSWRGDSELNSGSPTNIPSSGQNDSSILGSTHKLERSLSHQHNSTINKDGDSNSSGVRRHFNPSWDEDNLPEWQVKSVFVSENGSLHCSALNAY